MAKLTDDEVQRIVDAVVAELDRRKQIDDLANAIIRKQSELNQRLVQAPGKYQNRQQIKQAASANSSQSAQAAAQRDT